jgi:hypothetical protein
MKPKSIKIISCKDAANYICENLDEQIDSPVCREIKKHLQNCPDCSLNLADLKKTISLYRRYPSPKLTSIRHKHLMAKLAALK